MRLFLPDYTATENLGHSIARAIQAHGVPVPVFFYGELGAGKTTLAGALARALPGGKDAEISSPSFTLCNMYPTVPPIAHFDLYRQENGSADESLLDFLDGERHVVLVEWAERLPRFALPPNRLSVLLTADGGGRTVAIKAHGSDAAAFLRVLETETASAGINPKH